MLKIRRPLGRLIFNMGIAIPGKTVFLIETAPRKIPYGRHAVWIDCQRSISEPLIFVNKSSPGDFRSNLRPLHVATTGTSPSWLTCLRYGWVGVQKVKQAQYKLTSAPSDCATSPCIPWDSFPRRHISYTDNYIIHNTAGIRTCRYEYFMVVNVFMAS